MASVLPFNHIKIDTVEVAGPDAFVHGTGRLTVRGEDSALTTSDGLIHNYRNAEQYEAACELKGNFMAKETASPATLDGQGWPQLAGTVSLGYVSARAGEPAELKAFAGIITVEYDSENDKSTVTISG